MTNDMLVYFMFLPIARQKAIKKAVKLIIQFGISRDIAVEQVIALTIASDHYYQTRQTLHR